MEMGESANERVVERLMAGLNAGDVEVMNEVFTDDSVIVWPQSGETIRGKANRQAVYGAFPALPTITPYRMLSAGDLVTAEATLDYGGDAYEVVFIFEFREGRIAQETAYWSKPFPAPEWRAPWVELTTS
jgi:ketosteroid isomerase-like protein